MIRESSDEVCAIIVTYRPEPAVLSRVLEAVATQVGHVLVFDNASPGGAVARLIAERAHPGVLLIASEENVGLGAAFNRAAQRATELGAKQLLLMDQDSVLAAGMVSRLREASVALSAEYPVAAVGPQFVDARSGDAAPFVRVGFPFNRKLYGGPGERIEADFLITSGTLVSLEAWQQIGGMDEGLFIDNVDLEWCFRARHQGLKLFGICDARMQHSIGDQLIPSRIKRSGVVLHAPLRLYYIMRNRVALYGRRETPLVWIAQDLPRLLIKFVGTGLFFTPRRAYLHNMLRGLWDGVRGRQGPRPAGLP